jgi:hypothetical protein
LSKYSQPPFETKDILIRDTFDPENPASESVVDYNDFTNKELLNMYFGDWMARKLLDWRYENNVGLDEEDSQDKDAEI